MKERETEINPLPADQEDSRQLTDLVFLLFGLLGFLLFLDSLEGLAYSRWLTGLISAVWCLGLWYAWNGRKRGFFVLSALAAAAALTLAVLEGERLMEQLTSITSSLLGRIAIPAEAELAVLVLAMAWAWILCALELAVRSHLLLYLLTTGVLLAAPITGNRAGLPCVSVLALFQVSFWSVRGVGVRKGVRKRTADRTALFAAALWGVILLAGICLASGFEDSLYQAVYETEGFVTRTLRQLSGQADEPSADGRVSRGNLYRTGTEQLEVEVSSLPEQTLYLKGFTGGTYIGDEWIRSGDDELFDRVAEILEWEQWAYMISGMYYNMYYTLNSHMPDPPEPNTVVIRHSSGEYDQLYAPYYSQSQRSWSYEAEGGRVTGYSCRYFEGQDMNIQWDQVELYLEREKYWYQMIQEAYGEAAREAYTQVPADILPRLTQLCRENPLEDLDEITAFILHTLAARTTYTLTPGYAPLNGDVVENFLFETGRGYCVHYASAAALMYRLYGIPARYAAGYVIAPDDFRQQDDGSWLASVTDEAAHAWVEIFLEDYGWTPVEVTPASGERQTEVYPGFDAAVLENWSGTGNGGTEAAQPSGETAEETGRADDSRTDENTGARAGWDGEQTVITLGCLSWLVWTLLVLMEERRNRRLAELETMDCPGLYDRLAQVMGFGRKLDGWDGSQGEMAKRLTLTVPAVSPKDADRAMEIFARAAYGKHLPEAGDMRFVRDIYRQAAGAVCRECGPGRRWMFRYLYVFGK